MQAASKLRDCVLTANTVGGRLVAIPQEIVAYGLFCNVELFEKYDLALPETPEDLLHCCQVFQENGIEYPIGANRWWLELFVLAQGFADMYIKGDPSAEIEALNRGETRLRDYMRPGLEYLQLLFDRGYIDYQTAYTYEAMDEAPKFLAQETPIVMSYQGAAAPERNYGDYVLATNGNLNVELWGNTCVIVQHLMAGAAVEECLAEFDALQDAAVGQG